MGMRISQEERNYADQIYQLRQKKDLNKAIGVCLDAIARFQTSNFFHKLCGDIYYELREYQDAVNMYMEFLDRIKGIPEYFTNFTKFIKKVNFVYNISENVFDEIARRISDEKYAFVIRKGLVNVLLDVYPVSIDVEKAVEQVKANHITMEQVKRDFEKIKSLGKCKEIIYLCKASEKECQKENHSINCFLLKRLEKNRIYEYALKFVNKILAYSMDAVMVRTLFRICRYCENYDVAENYLKDNNIENKNDFNIQYELVFYYDAMGDEQNRNETLKSIERLAENRLPICQTLFKFYVKYNMLDKAQNVQRRIMSFQNAKNLRSVKQETEEVVWEKLRMLVSEQEHNRQLLAMSELIKGFSHELGQPITNIRYAIQLYYRKKRKFGIEIDAEQQQLLNSVLQQTVRVGKLLHRFAPIVSSKNEKKYFGVVSAIEHVFDDLSVRLHSENIQYTIIGDNTIELFGEELQFGQVFYNLIINSIYAIQRSGRDGILHVQVQRIEDSVQIEFMDNGIGIPIENQRKIFNPFFSTKNKETEEGGEGLGLFIVWNILKIFSGKIYVDQKYNRGAKFIIEFEKKEQEHV